MTTFVGLMKQATERIELSTPSLRDLCSATELSGRQPKRPQSAGLEPARAEPSGFLVHPLNRLGTTAAAAALKVYPWWDSNPQSLA